MQEFIFIVLFVNLYKRNLYWCEIKNRKKNKIKMMVLLRKIVRNCSLKTITIFSKILILHAWLGPGHASVGWYVTALKIKRRCV